MPREIVLKPQDPISHLWEFIPNEPAVEQMWQGFPVKCWYHPSLELTVMSGIRPNSQQQLGWTLVIAKRGVRQASEQEWKKALQDFKAENWENYGREQQSLIFFKPLPSKGPIAIRVRDIEKRGL